MAEKEVKKKTLDDVLKELNKTYGTGSVITGKNLEDYTDVISTGSLGLDLNLGIGRLIKQNKEVFWATCEKDIKAQSLIMFRGQYNFN